MIFTNYTSGVVYYGFYASYLPTYFVEATILTHPSHPSHPCHWELNLALQLCPFSSNQLSLPFPLG